MQLNADQQAAVGHDGHSLVVACPGSGKTRVITIKIGSLLKRHARSKVCAVTFTRDASEELRRRVVSEIGAETFSRRCMVGTFHSLAIKQLRSHNAIGKIVSPAEQRAYLKRAMALAAPEMDFETAIQLIECAKTSFGDNEAKQSPLYLAYSNLLARNKVEDLYDVLRRSVELMRSGDIKPINVQFMLVDEFQDTDHVQLSWVMEHVKAGTNVTVVGDDDQSIYGWRGALGYGGMQDFASQTDAKQITLAVNYRCHEEILSAADSLISLNDARVPKRLYASRGQGGKVRSLRYADRFAESEALADTIKSVAIPIEGASSALQCLTVPHGDWGVLCRNRFILDLVEEALMAAGIKYRRSASESVWNRPPFVFILSLLRSIQTGANDGIDHALSHALTIRAGHMVAHSTITALHNELGSRFVHLLDDNYVSYDSYDSRAAEVIRAFAKRASGWRQKCHEGKYSMVVRGVTDWFASFEEKEDRRRFITSVGELACKLKGTLVQRANALSSRQEKDPDEEPDGVALFTMHSSKGLEFNNVWIVGCDVETIPSPKSDNYSEERRLMYVAMTRAKDNLYMSSIITAEPSPFVIDSGYDPRVKPESD